MALPPLRGTLKVRFHAMIGRMTRAGSTPVSFMSSPWNLCEVAVIDTQLMQHGGMQVPDMHDIIYGVITKIISGTIAGSGLDTSTGHPH